MQWPKQYKGKDEEDDVDGKARRGMENELRDWTDKDNGGGNTNGEKQLHGKYNVNFPDKGPA